MDHILPLLNFFSFLVFIFLAGLIFIKGPGSALNRICAVLCSCFSVWSFGKVFVSDMHLSDSAARIFENIASVGWINFSIFFLLFSLVFTGQKRILGSKIFYFFLCIAAAIFNYKQWTGGLLAHTDLPYWRGNLWAGSGWPSLFFIYYFIAGAFSFYLLLAERLKSQGSLRSRQTSLLLITAAISFLIASLLDVVLPSLKVYLFPSLGNFFALIWGLGVAYSVFKYKFLAITPAIAASNIISTISDGLILLDKNSDIININKSALDMLGYQERDLIGRSFCEFFCIGKDKEDVLGKLAKGDPIRLFDYHLQTKDKQEILIILTTSALRDDLGNAVGTVCLLTDISERRRMEEALRQSETKLMSQVEMLDSALKDAAKAREIMVSMLEDNNEVRIELENKLEELKRTESMLIQSEKLASLGRLISDMAHEVNNPLMIITGNAQLALMEELGNKEAEEHLRTIVDQCNRAKGIIERLLKFSKPSKGEIREVHIEEVIEGVLTLIEHQFSLRNIKLIRRFAPSLPAIKIDDKQIQEVFANIINNSAEAISKEGAITISTSRQGDYIRVDLKDTGQGILEQDLDKIFEPFFTTKDAGTGLGLAVCYGIIQAHGGQIRYESRPGEGATAIVLLPVKEVNA